MKHIATLAAVCILHCAWNAQAQPICDFLAGSNVPVLSYTDNLGAPYTTWTPGSQNWEIINTSTIGNPVGSPYVLHTNPVNGTGGQSPQWLTSQLLTGFSWQYNELQWSFWFGRRANNGQNGGNQDRSTIWLYVNRATELLNFTGLEGIRLTWHHNSNTDAIQLVEVYGGVEHIIADFDILVNLNNYEWGTAVVVNRIPVGIPTGTQVRWQIRLSTPIPGTANFSTYSVGADTDPISTATYLRADVTLPEAQTWIPTSTSGRIGVMSDYAGSRQTAAEYNQICVLDKGPVPVELTSFSGEYRNGTAVLKWNTATETNNAGFEIQRSLGHNGNWSVIGFVDGMGTTSSPQEYRFMDHESWQGANVVAYRLKQIDRDGSYEYSNTILLAGTPGADDALFSFPNPFTPSANISFSLDAPETVSLRVYDEVGRNVAVLYDGMRLEAGFHTIRFDGSGLPAGAYLCRLVSSSAVRTIRLTLSK